MARLAGRSTAEVQAARLAVVHDVARRLGAVTVLKGRRTLVADPAGRVAVNPTGNPGMATAGTGDVLAGLGGVLLAGHDPWLAAGAAVFLHGRAGDLASARVGEAGLVASDLVDALPAAVAAVRREASRP
jgi:NAD(P)H-hydrate epimerase